MKKDRRMAAFYILIAILFAIATLTGTLSSYTLVWLAALIFLGLGIYRLSKALKKK